MITWGQLANHPSRFFDMFKTDRLFVRPDSGSKTFSGQVFETSTILEEMKFLDRYSSVAPETIIWVGGAKTIERECSINNSVLRQHALRFLTNPRRWQRTQCRLSGQLLPRF